VIQLEPGAMRFGIARLLAEVVDALEAELDVLVESARDRVMARIQATSGRASTEIHEGVRRGASAAARDALARLRSQARLPQQELLPELVELARLCADARCELAELADGWLVGQEVFWDRFQAVAEQTLIDKALCWEVVKAGRARLSGNATRLSELFRRAYEHELAGVTELDDTSDLRAVLRVLQGQWVEPSELGYDLAAHHVAVIVDSAASLDDLVLRSGWQLLRVRAPSGELWGWLGTRTRIAEDDIDALLASQRDAHATVAFGEPAEGIAGFATSHQQALEARAVAAAAGQTAIRFGDCRLLIAVLRDDELAKGLIERELGDLDRPGERMHELRETLRTYLEHSQSVSATAALRRHDRKTIERQLRAAEELINHRASDRPDDVLVALRVAEILRNGDRHIAER